MRHPGIGRVDEIAEQSGGNDCNAGEAVNDKAETAKHLFHGLARVLFVGSRSHVREPALIPQNDGVPDLSVGNGPVPPEQSFARRVVYECEATALVKPDGPACGLPRPDKDRTICERLQVRQQCTADTSLLPSGSCVGMSNECDITDVLEAHNADEFLLEIECSVELDACEHFALQFILRHVRIFPLIGRNHTPICRRAVIANGIYIGKLRGSTTPDRHRRGPYATAYSGPVARSRKQEIERTSRGPELLVPLVSGQGTLRSRPRQLEAGATRSGPPPASATGTPAPGSRGDRQLK